MFPFIQIRTATSRRWEQLALFTLIDLPFRIVSPTPTYRRYRRNNSISSILSYSNVSRRVIIPMRRCSFSSSGRSPVARLIHEI